MVISVGGGEAVWCLLTLLMEWVGMCLLVVVVVMMMSSITGWGFKGARSLAFLTSSTLALTVGNRPGTNCYILYIEGSLQPRELWCSI